MVPPPAKAVVFGGGSGSDGYNDDGDMFTIATVCHFTMSFHSFHCDDIMLTSFVLTRLPFPYIIYIIPTHINTNILNISPSLFN